MRRLDAAGIARAEVIVIGEHPADSISPAEPSGRDRALLVPLITDGVIDERYLGAAGTTRARAHHASVMQELPIEAFRLGRGDAVIPTLYR